ncbi:efflux RND transporter periplasmic adaptor subunit [Planktosalinus lacus]|uniref:Hemolysin D n=1 Tax=Planktosalinus lacus TaxID=1526573 RepID=A0A8J2Y8T4_9FLAO|nr:efflux RND transporter periplasmic adaptor subunit [Planktosalinus lacus]GGD95265.1 hemolysin D [Planktosalinus lacus]
MNHYISYFLVLTILLTSCKDTENNTTETEEANNLITLTEDQFQTNAFKIDTLSAHHFPTYIRTQGVIDVPPQNKVEIHAMMGGFVKNISLLVGDKVEKDQVLVTLENPEFVSLQQEYLETREQLEYLRSEYERQTILLEENITSQKSFLKAESEYKTAVARMESLKKRLQLLNLNPERIQSGTLSSQVQLRSPISGFVSSISVNSGTYVSEIEPVMEIVNNDHMHLEMQVFERDIPQLKKGKTIVFKTPETTADPFMGTVHLIGTTVNNQTRTTQVHGHIPDSIAGRFAVGMFVEAQIETGSTTARALPKDAVVEVEGSFFVLLKEDTEGFQFKKVMVQPGKEHNGFVEIKNAATFPASAQFLVKGAYNLIGE